MKVLIVGDWTSDIYEKAVFNAFLSLGHIPLRFSYNLINNSLIRKVQYKLNFGPDITAMNKKLIMFVLENKPDLIIFYRGIYLYSKTLEKIKKASEAKLFFYNNDDFLSNSYNYFHKLQILNNLRYYDHLFVYRQKNIKELLEKGHKNISILRSYYIKENNYPLGNSDNKYKCDVSFIGHWEDDGRDEYLKFLIDNKVHLKLFGTLWQKSKYYDLFKTYMGGHIVPIYNDYNLAVQSAKITLVFLSKINNDTYTRRCFEIPATKTFMLCEYTEDMNSMFIEGKEAEYFRNKEELLEKIEYYLKRDKERKKIAEAGYQRLLKDKHEVTDRCREILAAYEKLTR